MNNFAVKVENISKVYRLYDRPADRLKESINPFGKKYHREFYALKDVSFEITKGETVGIIGKNGSGKSTLLKIIAGVLTPTAGNVLINGKVSALLELGTGFNPEFTGIENIYFSGTIMGYSKEEMDSKVESILSFADIGDFAYQPVKIYSSGMFVRLAFAVATNIDPEILIVDEALSVGDMFFQAKCMARMKRMIDNGTTLLFVSHDSGTIKQICKRGILLNSGNLILDSDAAHVADHYFKLSTLQMHAVEVKQDKTNKEPNSVFIEKTERNVKSCHQNDGNESDLEQSSDGNLNKVQVESNNSIIAKEIVPSIFLGKENFDKRASFERIHNGKACFINVQMIDKNGAVKDVFNFGEEITYRMFVEVRVPLANLNISYHVRTKTGVDVIYSDTRVLGKLDYEYLSNKTYVLDWHFRLNLLHGQYCMNCALALPPNETNPYWEFIDFVPFAYDFTMSPRKEGMIDGFVLWNNDLKIYSVD